MYRAGITIPHVRRCASRGKWDSWEVDTVEARVIDPNGAQARNGAVLVRMKRDGKGRGLR